jgi:hypothetical protein
VLSEQSDHDNQGAYGNGQQGYNSQGACGNGQQVRGEQSLCKLVADSMVAVG